ncbi:MAG: MoaD/ThiS family protein [Acidimicrobiales bacterium]
MARLVLLGPAHDAAGTKNDVFDARSLGAVLDEAVERYGPAFRDILSVSLLWVNGEPAEVDRSVDDNDVVTVLPPVSGG